MTSPDLQRLRFLLAGLREPAPARSSGRQALEAFRDHRLGAESMRFYCPGVGPVIDDVLELVEYGIVPADAEQPRGAAVTMSGSPSRAAFATVARLPRAGAFPATRAGSHLLEASASVRGQKRPDPHQRVVLWRGFGGRMTRTAGKRVLGNCRVCGRELLSCRPGARRRGALR